MNVCVCVCDRERERERERQRERGRESERVGRESVICVNMQSGLWPD